jgi:cytochrome c553
MDLETFDMALRQGIAPYTDRVMAPVMPYNAFHGMSDSDVAALHAYLQTLTPVTNNVKQSVPGPAAANLESPPAKSMPSPQINTSAQYGGYLVDSVAYCGQCHSPTDATGAVIKGRELAGGNQNLGMQQQQLFASPIIGSALTATGYTRETFIALFRTGKRPWGAGLPFQMPWRQYGVMSDNDLTAIWNYLQTKRLPGPWPVAPAASTRAATAAATRAAGGAAPAAATTAPTAGPVATQSR